MHVNGQPAVPVIKLTLSRNQPLSIYLFPVLYWHTRSTLAFTVMAWSPKPKLTLIFVGSLKPLLAVIFIFFFIDKNLLISMGHGQLLSAHNHQFQGQNQKVLSKENPIPCTRKEKKCLRTSIIPKRIIFIARE